MKDERGQGGNEPAGVAWGRSGLARTVALHVVLAVLAALALVPLVWLVCACFKTQEDLFAHAFLPWHGLRRLTLDNVRMLFAREPIGRWLVNSLLVSSLQTVLVVALSSLGGFALAKYHFVGRRAVMGLMLSTMLLPGVVLQDETVDTLPLGGFGMVGIRVFGTQYGVLMCGTLIAVLPVVLLFAALQRDFVSGLAAGAVKG